MSKGLEALERIGKCYVNSESKDLMFTDNYGDDYDIIKRELKALEVIKKKEVNFEVFGAFETYKDYEIYYDKKFHLIENKLTKQEYELLKEVLCND